jgi:hypothetical protein
MQLLLAPPPRLDDPLVHVVADSFGSVTLSEAP